MKKISRKFGFSLIELSVVILIIGILVIGITKGSRILREAKLKSARSLTTSSPVNLYSADLGFWFDAVSENAFDPNDAVDGVQVTNWYNSKQNPTDLVKVTQSTQGSRPFYRASGANGLPTLNFDGVDDDLRQANITGSVFSNDGKQITIFVVQKYYTPMHEAISFAWGVWPHDRVLLHAIGGDGNMVFDFGVCCPTTSRLAFVPPATYRNKFNIVSAVRRLDNFSKIRVNGIEYASLGNMTDSIRSSFLAELSISSGGSNLPGYYQHADISEIIVIKRGLQNSEISDIEKYLSAKWGVPLKGL